MKVKVDLAKKTGSFKFKFEKKQEFYNIIVSSKIGAAAADLTFILIRNWSKL